MGKKPKSKAGKNKANNRKIDRSTLPSPPAPVDAELGSAKLLDEPRVPGSNFKALDRDGYDDGGVGDLTLVIDLEDHAIRRKRGETEYFTALKADLLPRVTHGKLAGSSRREQKIQLAKMLFSDEAEQEDGSATEVYMDTVDGKEDEATKKKREDRLRSAKYALYLSSVLREPACCSLSLAEISKRYLGLFGSKNGGEAALRCATKAVEIASDGFYDNDLIAMEAEEEPKVDPKHEPNATYPGLGHPTTLKLQPKRVSVLCLRSALQHKGNALRALGREVEARECYEQILPLLADEPRCGRLDWERSSTYVNIGNTYKSEGNFAKAYEMYDIGEQLGRDHLEDDNGNKVDGMGICEVAMRHRSFCFKADGRDEEAKKEMAKVLVLRAKLNEEEKKQKTLEKEEYEKIEAQEKAKALAQQQQNLIESS